LAAITLCRNIFHSAKKVAILQLYSVAKTFSFLLQVG